ncbi:uncharacterized protein LOC124447480 isoform X2 [Xenia sp. Carnegie-2017]|uniref:uncharacterized protein LOC124447480 isoform X2 n=1 Tax=Xenia sp. Carnegie-2017 TaxID=2897299 RepID=UPI001F038F14|nr:uncharacterized protein LOC124447480 isoform X2 [Xenia sp. Carnegie-2017]
MKPIKYYLIFFYLYTMLLTFIDGLGDMTEKENKLSIIFVGDINFNGCVKYYVKHGFNTYNDTLAEVADVIREADIAVGNLESSLTTKSMTSKRVTDKRLLIDADPRSVEALNFAGFDIMSVANNHFNDYGVKPVNLTIDSLAKVGIESMGFNFGGVYIPQRPIIFNVKKIRVGFLGYCYLMRKKGEYCSRLRKRFNLNAGPVSFTDDVAKQDVQKLKIFRTGHSHQLTKVAIDEFERDAAKLKGPTSLSRILRMYVTRNGVIAADYLPVEIKFDREKKLLHPTLSNGRRWIEVCSKDDNACLPSDKAKEHKDN